MSGNEKLIIFDTTLRDGEQSPGASMTQEEKLRIAKALEMHYHFFPSVEVEEEQYGNAVLSRFPMRLVQAAALPSLPDREDLEPRGALWVAIDTGEVELQLINTHLGLNRTEQLSQMETLLGPDWLKHSSCRGPVVVLGDFNAPPRSKVCRRIQAVMRDVQEELEGHQPRATWFARLPLRRIDHIFVGSGIEVVRVQVARTALEKKASDHLPLTTDIRWT